MHRSPEQQNAMSLLHSTAGPSLGFITPAKRGLHCCFLYSGVNISTASPPKFHACDKVFILRKSQVPADHKQLRSSANSGREDNQLEG